jgi:hypothetical protein
VHDIHTNQFDGQENSPLALFYRAAAANETAARAPAARGGER